LVVVAGIDEDAIARRWGYMIGRACLDERQRRLWAASEAVSHGRGGIAAVARVTGLAQSTVREGIKDLRSEEEWQTGQQRRAGAGRPGLLDRRS
jgi:predicted ArsR family transcriptional regulator